MENSSTRRIGIDEKSQPYVKIVDVSIDAGTKDTYENKTRLVVIGKH